jgi:hypothetical protein
MTKLVSTHRTINPAASAAGYTEARDAAFLALMAATAARGCKHAAARQSLLNAVNVARAAARLLETAEAAHA